MTTANKITILRILLIPFFVVELIYYLQTGNELYRLLALLTFAVTAILDGVDGYIARRYNQKSELGAILDPLADKLLLVSGIVTLSFNHGSYIGQIPLWLTGTIIGRDLLVLVGVVVVHYTVGKVKVRPHLTGKIATVFQMLLVSWILLRWDFLFHGQFLPLWILGAGLFTAWVENRYIIGHGATEYHLSMIERSLIAGRAFWFYLGKLFVPVNLAFIYPRWLVNAASRQQYLFPAAALALAAALWLLRKGRKSRRAPLAGFICFSALLFPALGFFNVYPFRYSFVADHFQYLAGIALLVLAVSGALLLFDLAPARIQRLRGMVAVAIPILLGVLTSPVRHV